MKRIVTFCRSKCLILLVIAVSTVCRAEQKSAESFGRIVRLPGLSDTGSKDLYRMAAQTAAFEMGYHPDDKTPVGLADSLDMRQIFSKETSKDEKRLLLVGLKLFATSESHILLWGQTVKPDAAPQSNPDVEVFRSKVGDLLKQLKSAKKTYAPIELEVEFYQLSHIQPKQCLEVLSSLGYATGKPPQKSSLAQLPIILATPDVPAGTVVSLREKLLEFKGGTYSPQNRLMILYHGSQHKELVQLRKLLEQQIDVPSRQVLIEATVIELTEKGLKELGVEWEGRIGDVATSFKAEDQETPFRFLFSDPSAISLDRLSIRLKALIKQDEAEVLSCPSVLTLDNCQAKITVGNEVPILKTVISEVRSVAKVDIDYKKVGITLNIMPRISRDGSTVTMQIQTEVSEAPIEEFLEVEGDKIAPLVQIRRVETIAQVKNNTPFIIGGLIRNERRAVSERIPVLSKIPVLGSLFQSRSGRREKLEDIIVVTPRVIEPAGPKRPILPKDSARFDLLDNRLFRNSYRLKAQDVFDLDFIKNDRRIRTTFRKAREFAKKNPRYAKTPPFDKLAKHTLPGEKAIVVRMLYEIVKKLELHDLIKIEHMIFFEKDPSKPAGYKVRFLAHVLGAKTRNGSVESFLKPTYPKKVLVLRYGGRAGNELADATKTPVAQVEFVEFNSRAEVEKKWYEENRLVGYDRPRTTIFLDNQKDLIRLKAAILVREIILINRAILSLENFQVGTRIVIPEVKKKNTRIFLTDHTASRYHYFSEFYYAAFQNEFQKYCGAIQETLEASGN